jgi:hypothetical protein
MSELESDVYCDQPLVVGPTATGGPTAERDVALQLSLSFCLSYVHFPLL